MKILCALLAAMTAAVLLTGCDTVGRHEISQISPAEKTIEPETTVRHTETESVTEAVKTDVDIDYPDISVQNTGKIYEAEECQLNGLMFSDERKTYSGTGYVKGFSSSGTDTIEFDADIPSNQHYDIAFCIASENEISCIVTINGKELNRFTTRINEDEEFTVVTIPGVFMEKGSAKLELTAENGDIELDYMRISNSTALGEMDFQVDGGLSNENAGDPAKELMETLSSLYGEYVITGQYVSDESNYELEFINELTGRYPVIRFSAFHNEGGTLGDCGDIIKGAEEWAEKGGIVGFMWHWECPGETPSVNIKQTPTDFDLRNAVTDEYVAEYSPDVIEELCGSGVIPKDCAELIKDIDEVSEQLLKLKNKGIPVLWRPLHEASGDWFWWGAGGSEAYNWLWKLVYNRMTYYHKLDNLIWIWNGQSADTMVQLNTFDIASVDIYTGEGNEFGSRNEMFAALQNLVGGEKLIALSEVSSIPDIDAVFRDKAVWSFFGQWYGDYLIDKDGGFSEKYITEEEFIRGYNSVGALTLDEYIEMS